jgi:hypothetical protein
MRRLYILEWPLLADFYPSREAENGLKAVIEYLRDLGRFRLPKAKSVSEARITA